MTDRFDQLLTNLGPLFGLTLHSDKVGACSIAINPHTQVQLQLDISQENLLLFSKIIEIPPGKFRENILKEALKFNGAIDPLPGILAYLPTSAQLCLYQAYPLSILNGERLAALLRSFLEVVEHWHHAIRNGQTSPHFPSTDPMRLKP